MAKKQIERVAKVGFDYGTIPVNARQEMRHYAGTIKEALQRTQGDIITIGQCLLAAKGFVQHGQFNQWCERELGIDRKASSRFMQVAEMFGKCDTVSHLDFQSSALYALAAPSTPVEAREEAVARAEAGETITQKKAKAIVEAHKAEEEPEETDVFDDEDDDLEGEVVEVVNAHLPGPPAPQPAPTKLTKAQENDLTDEEWLEALPLMDKLLDEGFATHTFETAALTWRSLEKPVRDLKLAANRVISTGQSDPFADAVLAVTSIPHPREWKFLRDKSKGGFQVW